MKFLNALLHLSVIFLMLISTIGIAKADVKIIFTSNMPEIFTEEGKPGYAELGGYLETLKDQGHDVVFIHGGDSLTPNSLAIFDKGAHIIDVLNQMSPVAMSISKRELAYGVDELTIRTSEAQFPLLASNLTDTRSNMPVEGVLDQYSFTIDGKKIAITAILDKDVVGKYIIKNVSLPDRSEALQTAAQNLTVSNHDISILVTDDLNLNFDLISLDNLFDIVLISNEDKDQVLLENKTVFAHSGGMDVQIAEITIPDNFPEQEMFAKLIPLTGQPINQKIVNVINGYSDNWSYILDVDVGNTETPLNTYKIAVRTTENAFGNLVADVIRLEVNADIAFHNGGGIRGKKQYPANSTLTRRDIQRELPFGSQVQMVPITGKELYLIMENAVSHVEEVDGRFLHISGFQVSFDSRLPAGSRIKSIIYKNENLKNDEELKLATTTFIIGGGDGYTILDDKKIIYSQVGEKMLWHMVADYIKKKQVVSPVIEGRVIDIAAVN